MARLPQPGGDEGAWGSILNEYLSAAHNTDGTLKNGVVDAGQLSAGTANNGQVLGYNGSGLAWTTPTTSGSVPDADATTKGLVQLTGALGGTAANPTVPGLAAKANDNAVVHLSGNETVTGVKNFTGTLQAGGQTVVATNDARLTNERTPTNASVTPAKLTSANSPTNGQILSFNGTQFNWVAAPSGGGDPIMGGDLSGTASNAQIVANAVGATEIAANAVTTAKIADSNVTTAKLADASVTEPKLAITNSPANGNVLSWNGTAMSWTAPSGGGGGGSTFTATPRNTNYTASSYDFVVCDASAAGFNVTLPAPTNGAWVRVKKMDATVNAIQVLGGGANIDDSTASVSINVRYASFDFMADGTQWLRV